MTQTDDILEINRVAALYAFILDWFEFDRLGEVFAEDGAYESGAGIAKGLPALRDYFAKPRPDVEMHMMGNLVIEFAGADDARSVSKWLAIMAGKLMHGQYNDTWKRTSRGWRITSRASNAKGRPDYLR